jgi:hypothetical protein
MTSPRNTPRFGRWSSGEAPPFSDAEDSQETPPYLDADCPARCRPECHPGKVRLRQLFSDLADGYAVDEEDEDE